MTVLLRAVRIGGVHQGDLPEQFVCGSGPDLYVVRTQLLGQLLGIPVLLAQDHHPAGGGAPAAGRRQFIPAAKGVEQGGFAGPAGSDDADYQLALQAFLQVFQHAQRFGALAGQGQGRPP